jgi:hypothetical protein
VSVRPGVKVRTDHIGPDVPIAVNRDRGISPAPPWHLCKRRSLRDLHR